MQEKLCEIHFITMVIGHHSKYSGYHRLLDFIPHVPFSGNGISKFFPDKYKNRMIEKSLRTHYHYKITEIEREIEILSYTPFHRHIFHFIYGENSFCYAGNFNRRNKALVASYHCPESWFKQQGKEKFTELTKRMPQIDAAIAVSTDLCDFLQQYAKKVYYVPHGIDIDFFTPDINKIRDPNFCLFVGNWMRDFDTLKKVSRILAARAPEIRLEVVTPEKNHHHFEGTGIQLYSGISDEELREKYRQASVLIQPLLDCTANNSALEAMACGLPIIVTDVGGIRDYVTEEYGVLCEPQNAEQMADAVIQLLNDPERMKQMGQAARKRAEDSFAWPVVAANMLKIYSELW